jgi:hypothetical protein
VEIVCLHPFSEEDIVMMLNYGGDLLIEIVGEIQGKMISGSSLPLAQLGDLAISRVTFPSSRTL